MQQSKPKSKPNTLKLFAEPECWIFRSVHNDDWQRFACGPGDYGHYVVPDKIFGCDVREACRIHDWYYRIWSGSTEQDRAYADRIFYNNMCRIIVEDSQFKWLTRLRVRIAYIYYQTVRRRGALAFFKQRNTNENYREV